VEDSIVMESPLPTMEVNDEGKMDESTNSSDSEMNVTNNSSDSERQQGN
jgi:hypothetical protein